MQSASTSRLHEQVVLAVRNGEAVAAEAAVRAIIDEASEALAATE